VEKKYVCALKNVTRIPIFRYGKPSWALVDSDGTEIQAFSTYCDKILGKPFTTQKRYAEVVSQFIDYLIEADAFGITTSAWHLNCVIDAYPLLLRDGTYATAKRLREYPSQDANYSWMLRVAESLNRAPLMPASFSNTLAPINRFLRMSESLAHEAFEKATLLGLAHENTPKSLIQAIAHDRRLSRTEIANMCRNSVLGSVIHFKPQGITRPGGISLPARTPQEDMHTSDFPFECVIPLTQAATSIRDEALWLFLAGTGARASEAKNLQWTDLDYNNQKAYIFDPARRRLGGDLTQQEMLRFKGRTVSMTYFIQPFRQLFFEALERYLRDEFVACHDPRDSAFVFQYVEEARRGQPYVNASDAALNANFRVACSRISDHLERLSPRRHCDWTLHSLRHLFGVYIVNDLPTGPGQYGLELAEAQTLLGQKDPRSTRKYCRKKRRTLERKLRIADETILRGEERDADD
jgi:integrase